MIVAARQKMLSSTHNLCAGGMDGRSVGLCERYEEQKEEQDTNQEEVTGGGDRRRRRDGGCLYCIFTRHFPALKWGKCSKD